MLRFFAAALLLTCPTLAAAQGFSGPVIPVPVNPAAIPLHTGSVAGSSAPEIWMAIGDEKIVRNVTLATLTPVLPAKGKATGAAVIIAPGGGFMTLSMDSEGFEEAKWLADRGVAAFVLKYRLRPTEVDPADFRKQVIAMLSSAAVPGKEDGLITPDDALADGKAALALVRQRSGEWGVDPTRVGMLGFSAGAITMLAVALNSDATTMPAFIAPIYGPMTAVTVPQGAPPMFNVLAANDPLFAKRGFGLIDAWQKANRPVELHVYAKGGHGFGMGLAGTTSIDWIESFYHWLDTSRFLTARK